MSQAEFRHTALVYSSDAEYVETAVDFLRAGREFELERDGWGVGIIFE